MKYLMSRPKIYILGAGGQARVNISLIKEGEENEKNTSDYKTV